METRTRAIELNKKILVDDQPIYNRSKVIELIKAKMADNDANSDQAKLVEYKQNCVNAKMAAYIIRFQYTSSWWIEY